MKKEEEKNNKHEEAILKKNIFFESSSTNSNETKRIVEINKKMQSPRKIRKEKEEEISKEEKDKEEDKKVKKIISSIDGYKLECKDGKAIKIDKVGNKTEIDGVKKIMDGTEGFVLQYKDDRVLKVIKDNSSHGKQNMDCVRKLANVELGKNFVKILKVINDKSVVYNYIAGKNFDETITNKQQSGYGLKEAPVSTGAGKDVKLSLDFFVNNWITGTLEGMKKIYKTTGYYLIDRQPRNFIIQNYGTSEAILVQIDYDFSEHPETLASLFAVFIDVAKKNLEYSDRKSKLLGFLEIAKMRYRTGDVKNLDKILSSLKEI